MIIFEYLIILLLAIFLKFFLKIKYSVGSFSSLDQPNKEKIHKNNSLVGSYPIFYFH